MGKVIDEVECVTVIFDLFLKNLDKYIEPCYNSFDGFDKLFFRIGLHFYDKKKNKKTPFGVFLRTHCATDKAVISEFCYLNS